MHYQSKIRLNLSLLLTSFRAIWLPSFIILALVVLSLLSVNQTTSLIRTVGFSGFFLVLCVFSLWHLALEARGRIVLIIFIFWVSWVSFLSIANPVLALKNRIDYVSGTKSMWDAMAEEGNLYKPIVDIRKAIGMEEQIAYLQINGKLGQSYLIGRGLLNPISFSYFDKWHILAFEEPEKAIPVFKKMGINYFLIDLSALSYDLIAYSPLFNTDNIKKYLSLRWSSDPFYLFTWQNNHDSTSEINDNFLNRWSKEQNRPDHFGINAYKRMKTIYQYNDGRILGVKVPPNLPPLEGNLPRGQVIYGKGE